MANKHHMMCLYRVRHSIYVLVLELQEQYSFDIIRINKIIFTVSCFFLSTNSLVYQNFTVNDCVANLYRVNLDYKYALATI